MKNQCVAVENNGKKAYAKPFIEVVDLNAENIICASNYDVTNPFSNSEENWYTN